MSFNLTDELHSFYYEFLRSEFPLPEDKRADILERIDKIIKTQRSPLLYLKECAMHWAALGTLAVGLGYRIFASGPLLGRSFTYVDWAGLGVAAFFLLVTVFRQFSYLRYLDKDLKYLLKVIDEDNASHESGYIPASSMASTQLGKTSRRWYRNSRFGFLDVTLFVAAWGINIWIERLAL